MMPKSDHTKLEFGNENTVEDYHVFCRDPINCGSFGSACVGSKENGQTCQEEWRANKAANEAAKITEKDYVAKCRAESTTAKPAAAPPAAVPATTAAKPVTGKPKDARQAEYARERACGQDWKADKAANKIPSGMKWPQYWSECSKRKKAAGM